MTMLIFFHCEYDHYDLAQGFIGIRNINISGEFN